MSQSLPTNRDENWRYANLRPLQKAKPEAAVTRVTDIASSVLPPALAGFERWVFVDGRLAPALSAPGAAPVGAVLSARAAGAAFAEMLDGDIASAGVDFALARVNAQHGDEVLHLELADGRPRASIEVTFLASAPSGSGTSYPRVQVHAGRNSELCLIERHLSIDGSDAVVNGAVDIAVGAGAVLDHIRVQSCASSASCFDTLVANVAEQATYRLRSITLGGLTSRSTVFVKLAGRAARCELSAASVANGIQTHDLFAEIEHVGADSLTREMFRGIAAGRGKLAFNGKMIVRPSATGADSAQSLRSLLTGSGAEASVRPQLEIYTDRVRAVHGATTGKLDEQMLFYLLSRGIDRPAAQALLQWAFIEDALTEVRPAELRRQIETLIANSLTEVAALDGLLGGAT